ncbi:chemotaxis protein CheY [Lysinibacillus sp. NPDC096418]|uniref:chemotaxis protein CheY n=1 Tax=Lysinibacillus sp. NPDC096418 TaxID=3364138 RepID=UPI00381CAD94
MTIAIIVNDEEIITPITEGTVLRIVAQDGTIQDLRNPALDVTEGRRGAALRLAIEKGATTFVAPPETFCEISYVKAQSENIQFYHLTNNISYEIFTKALANREITLSITLPEAEILSSVPVTK